ncbi:MAG: hypothetical protein IPJ75_17610 [Ignavibacteriales bacterium]|nr:hypothetical protein [Ignavibacteriales bacterium]
MKKMFLVSALFFALTAVSFAQEKPVEPPKMKQWFFVMLSRGENRTQDSVESAKLQEGHMANINKMAELGVLRIAGPFIDNGNWRGIFIMDCKTIEEAESYVKQDPAIIAGRLAYEIHPWYGPATIKTNWDKE